MKGKRKASDISPLLQLPLQLNVSSCYVEIDRNSLKLKSTIAISNGHRRDLLFSIALARHFIVSPDPLFSHGGLRKRRREKRRGHM